MLEVRNLSITTLSGRKILENVSFLANDGDKIAIIGEEGNGKTTLLRAIVNRESLSGSFIVNGTIKTDSNNIGYLEQILDPAWNDLTALDYILQDSPTSEPNYEIYNDFGDIAQIASQFGLKEDFLDGVQPIGTLSGGEKVKLQLLKLMYKKPTLILMDEPTNDLDISTLEFLEDFINKKTCPIIYVSHDETLLEHTANHILHLEQIKRKTEPRATFATATYTEYVTKRLASLEKQDQIATQEQAERKEQLRITNEIKCRIQQANPGRTNSMRAVIAREARWERTKVTEHTDTEDSIKVRFFNKTTLPNQKIVLNMSLPELSINGRMLAKDIKLDIVGPTKVVIVGNNGCGKSTFLKQIVNYYSSNDISGIKVSYMPQNYDDFLNLKETPLDFLCKDADEEEKEMVRKTLGRLKFTSDEMTTEIKRLSGGQRAKIYLTKILLSDSNVLILDEPTRNLSPLSNPAVRSLFSAYGGAIISISHDRKFISEVFDEAYELTKNGLKNADYLLKENNNSSLES